MAVGSNTRKRIGVIDGLRGLAIALVVYFHVFINFTPPGYHTLWLGDVEIHPFSLLANGWVGVNLFFVDSGFVLFLPFASHERRIASWADVRYLYVRRAWRLLPLYYTILIGGLMLSWIKNQWEYVTLAEVVSCLTFTFPFHPSTWVPTSNMVLWSLGVEVWFSLLFPLFVLAIARFGIWRFLVIAFMTATLTRFAAYRYCIGDIESPYLNVLADSLFGRIDNFALGMMVAVLYRRGIITKLRPFLVGSSALGGTILVWYATSQWDTYYFSKQGLWAPIAGNILINIGCSLLLMGVLGSQGFLKRIFEISLIRWAGIGCYSLYLVHGMLLPFLIGHRFSVVYNLFFLIVIASMSVLTYHLIEKPTMDRGRCLSKTFPRFLFGKRVFCF
ncbi:acyltransferase [Candidatus Uhrbacteria bacterium]|nr:acyltransferase [Candidatus Uhrbacteria bacterium]